MSHLSELSPSCRRATTYPAAHSLLSAATMSLADLKSLCLVPALVMGTACGGSRGSERPVAPEPARSPQAEVASAVPSVEIDSSAALSEMIAAIAAADWGGAVDGDDCAFLWGDIDVGPGLFTGLRVGIAAAKAMAQALRVPMIGISSLDLLAWPVRYTDREIVAVVDARRGEVFHARYRSTPGGVQRVSEPQVAKPTELRGELQASDTEFLLVGDGALRYAEHWDNMVRVEVAEQFLAHPNASSLVQLAHARAIREQFVQPRELEPLYLRAPDAEINWTTRDG